VRNWGYGLLKRVLGKLLNGARFVVNGTDEIEEVMSLFVCIVDIEIKPTLMHRRT
jgi:hypothetical protein